MGVSVRIPSRCSLLAIESSVQAHPGRCFANSGRLSGVCADNATWPRLHTRCLPHLSAEYMFHEHATVHLHPNVALPRLHCSTLRKPTWQVSATSTLKSHHAAVVNNLGAPDYTMQHAECSVCASRANMSYRLELGGWIRASTPCRCTYAHMHVLVLVRSSTMQFHPSAPL